MIDFPLGYWANQRLLDTFPVIFSDKMSRIKILYVCLGSDHLTSCLQLIYLFSIYLELATTFLLLHCTISLSTSSTSARICCLPNQDKALLFD